ncbi:MULTISPECIES: MFS transporter [Ramlibacter]|uniref:MFS transporter n=1 Tax=Ramlibacter aquaticus TaxID=2780094 RepID=A0ABR9SG67_9BURK|nr:MULTISPECIES: MFS transporter [Ramlibacter]MBE7941313.1 MFS transporter [Ramlibacter aquaticus]
MKRGDPGEGEPGAASPDPSPAPAPTQGGRWRWPWTLPPDDLLRDRLYRRLWLSILTSGFGAQITMLAIPLTAAVLLHATPTQMGLLTSMELAPFILFSLPTGVWLDRVRKLPVYVAGELAVAVVLASVPAAWALGLLSIPYLYAVSFVIGCVFTTAGSASQIVLTQIVPRERLVEAHAKNALAGSLAEVTGPGAAGALIRLVGAPLALLADAALLLGSVAILRGLRIDETPGGPGDAARFWGALRDGLRFVFRVRMLVTMAVIVGLWQFCHQAAMVVQILFATRELGLDEKQVGLCYVGLGLGTITAGSLGRRIAERIGVGRSLLCGLAVCGLGWLQLAFAPATALGVASFVLMLACFGFGAVLIFINFLALRQALTPAPLLGRMTSTMRWLILLPSIPGALAGGWVGEHAGLRMALALGGGGALLVAAAGLRFSGLARQRQLPEATAST